MLTYTTSGKRKFWQGSDHLVGEHKKARTFSGPGRSPEQTFDEPSASAMTHQQIARRQKRSRRE